MSEASLRVLFEALRERWRQVDKGYDAEHDDTHDDGELAAAAACIAVGGRLSYGDSAPRNGDDYPVWPWDEAWGRKLVDEKPERERLIVAIALLVAEVERIDRRDGRSDLPAVVDARDPAIRSLLYACGPIMAFDTLVEQGTELKKIAALPELIATLQAIVRADDGAIKELRALGTSTTVSKEAFALMERARAALKVAGVEA